MRSPAVMIVARDLGKVAVLVAFLFTVWLLRAFHRAHLRWAQYYIRRSVHLMDRSDEAFTRAELHVQTAEAVRGIRLRLGQ